MGTETIFFINDLNYWHWFAITVFLLILEAIVPGAFFIWMSVAAGIVGLLKYVMPHLDIWMQFLIFAVLSIMSVLLWKSYQKKYPQKSILPTLNRRVEQYRGRVVTLEQPLYQGRGKVQIDDVWWDIEGPDLAAGTQVIVVDVKGAILKIEPKN